MSAASAEPTPGGHDVGGNRARLLDAGREILACGDTSLLQSGINPDRIARAAGVSRQTFYRHFPNKLDFLQLLAEALRLGGPIGSVDTMIEWLADNTSGDPKTHIDEVLAGLWDRLVADIPRERALQSLLHLGGDDPEISATISVAADERLEFYGSLWSRIFDDWGLELHDEWSLEDFVLVFDGVVAGAQRRYALDPEAARRLFRPAVWVLFSVALAPEDEERSVDLRVAVDRLSTELSKRWTEQRHNDAGDTSEVLNVRQRLIDSVITVVANHGYHGTTIDRIAAEAGVNETAVHAVGSIPALICLAISPTLSRLNRELAFDEAAGSFSVDETVDRHLDRVRVAVSADHGLFSAFAMVILESGASAAVRSTRAHFQGPLAEFLVRNAVSRRGRADQLLQRAIVGSMFGWPEETP